jgi:hypothetical protein
LGSVTRSEKCGEWGDLDKIRFELRVPLTSTCSLSLSLSLSQSGIDLLACASFSLLAPLLVISRFPSLSLRFAFFLCVTQIGFAQFCLSLCGIWFP